MVTRKPIDLPPNVARAFVKAMEDFFAEQDKHKQDAIAANQLSVMNQFRGQRDEPLRLSDIKEMFRALKGIVG
ncbi:hypothetical protein [Bradyrhizobium erythrophlei]|uniref:Uncharacterized protein n=1 Tax=Bradyrhizobium erythrophlei TaxID=1437360 RepID=A0A1M7TLG0_9BRAD|nr:hypothetical protein [Bradyrhizobium erythrophlei]SHN71550.1 hypothetical protein SAMN05444170_2057 [Bradyrhizobium erythrophlei]